ncbi:MAG: HAMP domain-containing histidine kinase [Lachnospiraceae bacterium]|nr:HAMP domain-containing histidine kinase [Lachnospiraceae bacterium]
MSILNNPQLIKELAVIDIICALAAMAGYYINPATTWLLVALMIIIDIVVFSFDQIRNLKIQRLSKSIDSILFGQNDVLITDCSEGELSILQNEISKMTIRLKEQSDMLLSDKVKLTNAIADIFHQLRTPLTSMNINVALLEDEDITYEQRLEITRKIYKQLDRIQWLVESLLKISKIDSKTAEFKSENLLVSKVLNKALEPLLVPLDIKDINLEVNVVDEAFTGDLKWTVEAIGNVLKNCMEHTPNGGMISIECKETALFTSIIIKDTGEGFSEEDLPYLFERFYNGKNAGKESIGIGLSLSRMIISEQNGTIVASNNKEGGACFEIKFYKNII